MTKRQKALGVIEYGYQRGCICGEFMADYDSFFAKAATLKKGQYLVIDIARKWFADECVAAGHHAEMKRFFFALSCNCPNHFIYSNTHGLDCLTVM